MWGMPMGYGYAGGPVAPPGEGLVQNGDEPWLDDLDQVEITKSCCMGGTLTVENHGGKNIEIRKTSGGCNGSYEAYVDGESKPVAAFNTMGSCGQVSRYVMCPPGREVINAVCHKVGYGKHAPYYYTSYLRGGGGMMINRPLSATCGVSMPVCDGMGRLLADVHGQGCCNCCGGLMRLRFDRDASATDKLAVLDWAVTAIDQTMANPCRWTIFLVIVIPLLFMFLMFTMMNLVHRGNRSSGTGSGSGGATPPTG